MNSPHDWFVLVVGIALGGGLIALAARLCNIASIQRFLENKTVRDWITVLAALAAAAISAVALAYSNYFNLLSSRDSTTSANATVDAAQATLAELRLERSPVLTERCSEEASSVGLDAAVEIFPNGQWTMSPDTVPPDESLFSKKNANYAICVVHNYGRLPAIHLAFTFGVSYCQLVNIMKTESLDVHVVAPGADVKIGLLNGSQTTPLTVVPLRDTSFVIPPDNAPHTYRFVGTENSLRLFTLSPKSPPMSGPGSQERAPSPSLAYCRSIAYRTSLKWQQHVQEGESRISIGQRYTFHPMLPQLPVASMAVAAKCPSSYIQRKGSVQGPLVWINEPKTFEVTAVSPDRSVTTMRGPSGGIVCVATVYLLPR
jgi:hypothetical protein